MSNFVGIENNTLSVTSDPGSVASGSAASSVRSTGSLPGKVPYKTVKNIRSRYFMNTNLEFNPGKARNAFGKPNNQTRLNRKTLLKYLEDELVYQVKDIKSSGIYLLALQAEYDQSLLIDKDQQRADQVLAKARVFYNKLKGLFPNLDMDVWFNEYAPELLAQMKLANERRASRSRPSTPVSRPSTPGAFYGGRKTRRNRKATRRNRKANRKTRRN